MRTLAMAGVLAVAASYAFTSSGKPLLRDDTSVIIMNKNDHHESHNAKDTTAQELQRTDYEQLFVNGINRTNLKEYLHAYASKPHPVGSKQDYETAVYTKKMFELFGIEAEIKT
jgi:hypothetical protein